jgi:hypothetical protein
MVPIDFLPFWFLQSQAAARSNGRDPAGNVDTDRPHRAYHIRPSSCFLGGFDSIISFSLSVEHLWLRWNVVIGHFLLLLLPETRRTKPPSAKNNAAQRSSFKMICHPSSREYIKHFHSKNSLQPPREVKKLLYEIFLWQSRWKLLIIY